MHRQLVASQITRFSPEASQGTNSALNRREVSASFLLMHILSSTMLTTFTTLSTMESFSMFRLVRSIFAFTGPCTNALPSSTRFLPRRNGYPDPRPPAHPPSLSLALRTCSPILDSSQLTPARPTPWTLDLPIAHEICPYLPHRFLVARTTRRYQQRHRHPRPPPQPPPHSPFPTILTVSRYQQLTRPRRRRRPPDINPSPTASTPQHRTHRFLWQLAFIASIAALEFSDFQDFLTSAHRTQFTSSKAFGRSPASSLGLLVLVSGVLCIFAAALTGNLATLLRFASFLTSDLAAL